MYVCQAVRKTLLERGIRPETLPAAEDVKKVERRLASEEKKSQIKSLHEKSERTKAEISLLAKKIESLEKYLRENSNIDEKYESLNLEIQDISLRTRETVQPETGFKARELERFRISLKQLLREEQDVKDSRIG